MSKQTENKLTNMKRIVQTGMIMTTWGISLVHPKILETSSIHSDGLQTDGAGRMSLRGKY